jgi:hypothetical protein
MRLGAGPSKVLLTSTLAFVIAAVVLGGAADATPTVLVPIKHDRTPSSTGAAMRVSRAVVAPGGTVKVRVEAGMEMGVSYGLKFWVQVLTEGRWELAPFSPPGPWPEKLVKVRAGDGGPWQSVVVPADASGGTYRFKKAVTVDGHRRFVSASFEVRG